METDPVPLDVFETPSSATRFGLGSEALAKTGRWLVRVQDVAFTYPNGVEALRNVSLEIREGEIVSLVGPSGCGKSTLIAILAELRTGEGKIVWNADSLQDLASGARRKFNVVFQQDTLLPWLSVEKNIAFGLRYLKISRSEAEERVTHMLKMGGLTGFRHAHPGELSGGMARRVALLAGVATFPKLLILDEPFSALDEPTRIGIHDELLTLVRDLDIAVLLITHDLGEAVSLSERVGVMTKRPAEIAHVEAIELGRYRKMTRVRTEEAYLTSYKQVWDKLWQQIEGDAR